MTWLFSVGIVLFEMFLQPLSTATERLITLQNLRNMLQFPDYFGNKITHQHKHKALKLINLMLKANPSERPSVGLKRYKY